MLKPNQPMKIIMAIVLAAAVLAGSVLTGGEAALAASGSVDRLKGDDRYATSAAIALEKFSSSDYCIITRGDVYADGLAASTLAGALNCPILLTRSTELPTVIKDCIKSLGNPKVIILGGTSAVSSSVESALKNLVGSSKVERISGATRFDTAAKIAARAKKESVLPNYAFIVSGWASADSLVAGPAAFLNNAPLLQVEKNSIPDVTKKAISDLGISRLYIVGGTAVVSNTVKTALEKLPSVSSVTRISGATRYETSVEFARSQFSGVSDFSLVRGADANLADAIGATVLGLPILYVEQNSIPAAVSSYLDSRVSDSSSIRVIGGIVAVSNTVEDRAKALVHGTTVFNPAQGATSVSTSIQPTITFPRAITLTGGGTITDSNVDSLITFRKGGSSGTSVSFAASIDSAKRVITVRPTSALETNTTYYLAVSSVKDSGGTVSGSSVTWSTGAVATGIPDAVFGLEKAECVSFREIIATFNRPVIKTTAEKTDNYTLDPSKTIIEAKLRPDGKTVLLTLDSTTPLAVDTTYTLTAENVFSTGGRYVDDPFDKQAFRATDHICPTVESITISGKQTLLVTMSEYCKVDTEPLVWINDDKATISNWDGKSFTASTGSDWVKDRAYKIQIAGIKDLADNVMKSYMTTVKPLTSEAGPSLSSVSAVDQDTVKVVFDRPLGDLTDATVTYKKGKDASSVDVPLTTEDLFTRSAEDSSGKTYFLDVPYVFGGIQLFTGTITSETITIEFKKLKDVAGYPVAERSLSKQVTLRKDTTNPYITTHDVDVYSNVITLYLNEQTSLSGSLDNINVTCNKKLLTTTSDYDHSFSNDSDNNISTITFTAKGTSFDAGEYVINIPANTVRDGKTYTEVECNNSGTDFTQNLTIGKTNGNINVDYKINVGAPGLNPKASTVVLYEATSNKLLVTYNVRMGDSAVERANYLLRGEALPSSAKLAFVDTGQTQVLINLAVEGTVNFGQVDHPVTGALDLLANIKSAVGYAIQAQSFIVADAFEDNTPPKLQSAEYSADNKTLTLTFNENMDPTHYSLANYQILCDSKIVGLNVEGEAVPGDPTKVKFVIPTTPPDNWNPNKTIKVVTKSGAGVTATDANGVIIQGEIEVTVKKVK